jgi:phenylacetate-coenzyme A ligase PaaK-like adenylate-forming protein
MFSKNNFKKQLFKTSEWNFNEKALELFQYQAQHNKIYGKYLDLLKIKISDVQQVEKIPFMPICFFKYNKILTGEAHVKISFQSSGTTGSERSIHYITDPEFYQEVSLCAFENFYGSITDYVIVALLPSYLENANSSLIYMVNHFIKKSANPLSSFINEKAELYKIMNALPVEKKILIIGVTYALEMAGTIETWCKNTCILMETGGMKGRSEEKPREQVHERLKKDFNLKEIHSEYGMTELLTQAYAKKDGIFHTPPWMKVFIREINDPFRIDDHLHSGGINIIDLANVDSCAFIETEDIGKKTVNEGFMVLGRLDNAETRGCNLLSF